MRVKARNFGGIQPPRARLVSMMAVLLAAVAVFFGRLVRLQMASHDEYTETSLIRNTVVTVIPTTRGEICDAGGVPLVWNDTVRNITFDKSQIPTGQENASALALLQLFDKNGIVLPDVLPVSTTAPFLTDSDYDESSEKQRAVRSYANYMGVDVEKLTASRESLYAYLANRYKVDELSDITQGMQRRVVGLRFTLDVGAYASSLPYTLAADADDALIDRLSDSFYRYPGLAVSTEASRMYHKGGIASQILGRTDVIYAEDADVYREKGYDLTEKVGKTGAEYAFEDLLRGINGKRELVLNAKGDEILDVSTVVEPKPGYTVRLTIDAGMQTVAEDALREVITAEARRGWRMGGRRNGEDACAGAVVVMNVKDGGLPVVASYPTFDQNTYRENVEELLKQEPGPFLNRATSGLYEPGSTFKIATAAAALHYGVITPETTIYDKGEFEDYETYKPHCWIYDRFGYTHGYMNVQSAIQNSCNYFFFRVGKQLGIEKLDRYAEALGLGKETGIEIGESRGIVASPAYKESVGLSWNPGDTLQAAIGQAHLFTPLQLASYITTVLNGGVRYRAHLFDACIDYATGEEISRYEKEVLSTVEIPPQTVNLLKEAMRRVIDEGTAANTFADYPYPVGGKTGTAEVGNGSDNVLFVGFAPFDDPEIVVAVVLEHGNRSSNAAEVAKRVFDRYFEEKYAEKQESPADERTDAAPVIAEVDTEFID